MSHGDELAYLFDPQHLDGTPAEQTEISEEDEKVRANFAQMVADFARAGKVKVGDKPVKPFTGDANSYIQITPDPKVVDNFEFCKMGLWLGLAQRLQSSVCGFLNVLDSELKNVEKTVFNAVNATNDQLNKLTGGLTKPLTDPNSYDPFNLLGGKKSQGSDSKTGGLGLFGQKQKVKGSDEKMNSSLNKFSKPLSVFKGNKHGGSLFGLK